MHSDVWFIDGRNAEGCDIMRDAFRGVQRSLVFQKKMRMNEGPLLSTTLVAPRTIAVLPKESTMSTEPSATASKKQGKAPLQTMPVTRQQSKASEAEPSKVGTNGRGLHLTPTKRKKPATETYSERRRQSRCRNCNAKTIMVCNYCRDNPDIGEKAAAYCCPTTDRDCYSRHMAEHHS
jgi:hypothetical protein